MSYPAARIGGGPYKRKVPYVTRYVSKKRSRYGMVPFSRRRMLLSTSRHLATKKSYIARSLKFIGDSPFPEKYTCKLTYAEPSFQYIEAAGALKSYIFGGNDPYDPYTGVGDYSALGLTELAAIYESMRCIGSRITVTGNARTVTDNKSLFLVVYPEHDASALATVQAIRGHPNQVNTRLQADLSDGKVSHYASTKGIFNLQTLEYDFSAGTGASPTNKWYWHIYFYSDALSWTVNLQVTIEYYMEFYNKKNITQAGL